MRVWTLGGTAVALAWGAAATAGETPLYQPAPAWVTPAAAPDTSKLTADAPILLIYDQQQRIEKGQVWSYTDIATRIASADVLTQAGTVQLPWQPGDGDLIVHRVEILRGSELIDLVKAGQRFAVLQREEQLEQLMLSGILSATMTVEGLRVGDVLRIGYSTTNRDRALKGKAQAVMLLPRAPARIGFGRARLSWPEADAVKWRMVEGVPAPTPAVTDGMATLELKLPIAKAEDLPPDAPARFNKLPFLEATSFADWADVSRTFAPLYATDSAIPAGSSLAEQVAKIRATAKTPAERAAAALRLVQEEVRYLYRGMDGGNYLPQSAAQTWSTRYGDCKAKTLLLLALLRALDVEAAPALASVGLGEHVPGRLPSAAAFNHVLVRAVVDGKPVWLDGTGRGARLADLTDVPAIGFVLPLSADGAEPVRLVATPPARPVMDVTFEFDQRAGVRLPTLFEAKLTLRGAAAEQMYLGASQATDEQKLEAASGMVSQFLGETALEAPSFAYDAERGEGTIRVKGLATSLFRRIDERYRFTLDRALEKSSFEPDRARAAWRSIPVRTSDPSRMVMTTRVQLPDGGKGYALDGATSFADPMAGLVIKRTASLNGGTATVIDDVANTGVEIAPDRIAEARAAMTRAKARPLRLVAPADLPPHWTVAEPGNRKALAPLIGFYDRAVAKAEGGEANELAGILRNRANFYAGIYDYPAALKDVARLVELEETAANRMWQARLLNFTGKPKEALVAAEAALALDPGSNATRLSLAGFHAEAGDAEKALALLDETSPAGEQEKTGLLLARAEVQRLAGKPELAVEASDAAVSAAGNSASAFNGRCWNAALLNRTLDKAMQDCTRAIELGGSASALDSRALVYFRLNRLDEALTDLNAALTANPELPASLYMRGIVRGSRGDRAGAAADLAAARLIRPGIDADYARFGIKP